jgi:hypothetical protein
MMASWRWQLDVALKTLRNYAKGYALSPVLRWRCCYGTVPVHHSECITQRQEAR